jgi:hypothetical protein
MQEQTQYRRPTVKEHDHHWDSHQDFNELENCINFNKSISTILSPSVIRTWQRVGIGIKITTLMSHRLIMQQLFIEFSSSVYS